MAAILRNNLGAALSKTTANAITSAAYAVLADALTIDNTTNKALVVDFELYPAAFSVAPVAGAELGERQREPVDADQPGQHRAQPEQRAGVDRRRRVGGRQRRVVALGAPRASVRGRPAQQIFNRRPTPARVGAHQEVSNMSGLTDFAQNKVTDAVWRAQALGAPPTWYFALLTCTKGARANSTAYALNDTIAVLANDTKNHLYKCTTAGTTAAAQSTLYPGAVAEAITDGTAVFTEQSAALDAGNAMVEVVGAVGYARAAVTAALTAFAGTQGAGTTLASTGSTGTTSNNATITFPAPSGQWVPAGGAVWGMAVFDAAAAGNAWQWGPLVNLKTSINTGDPAPSWAAGAATFQIGY